ncbi:hypothetical protein DJICPGNB_08155 [Escherichia coli]|nr:hypothetical protein DJICPGNB_08155 [Escherichia coli]
MQNQITYADSGVVGDACAVARNNIDDGNPCRIDGQ